MLNRPITPAGRALFVAGVALFIVLVAFIGLARLAVDEPVPPARVAAPQTERLAGQVEFDAAAIAAERRQDIVGALLTFFLLGGAVCVLAGAAWAGVLALRGARPARGGADEEAFGPLPDPKSSRSQLG
jgi:hypothetical protein